MATAKKKVRIPPNPLDPSPALLCKLGSIAQHVDELTSSNGHAFDVAALKTLLQQEDVREWLDQMEGMALIPKKR